MAETSECRDILPEPEATCLKYHDALRRIAARYQSEGRVIEEVTIRRAIEELFSIALPQRGRSVSE